jgi:hypothetical protein
MMPGVNIKDPGWRSRSVLGGGEAMDQAVAAAGYTQENRTINKSEPSGIDKAIQQLAGSANRLDSESMKLLERLHPIAGPGSPQCEPCATIPPSGDSRVVTEIDEVARMLDNLADRLRDYRGRLEL